ncbi:lipase lipl-1-like [Eriocheir sinensis]|uniref:lipase lipl-1-like n=1 Tax=Eriocheir sinensis TaxID=95602 RepID=UPI0021CA7DAC|nr:lipase lipl-1-like [Eriocheir sinensis]
MHRIMRRPQHVATLATLLLAMVTQGGGRESDQVTVANYLHSPNLSGLTEHPDARLSTPELIKRRGYPIEIHEVVTEDGYIIELHRIPHGRYLQTNQYLTPVTDHYKPPPPTSYGQYPQMPSPHYTAPDVYGDVSNHVDEGRRWRRDGRNETYGRRLSPDRKVVLVIPGIFATSADFVLNDPDQALAFILADQGYDVWLGNYRGNFYGRRHKYLSPSDPAFWDHTWNELARLDVPAQLSYVREVSGSARVSYVGYSMGTSLFFAMFSYYPEMTSWVRSMVALAPVGYIYHRALPLGLLSPFYPLIERVLQRAGILELLPLMPDSRAPQKAAFCGPYSPTRPVCVFIQQFQTGFNREYIDKEYLPVILAHFPAGASYKVFVHLLQLHASPVSRSSPSLNLPPRGS